jgi:hypothetical protein
MSCTVITPENLQQTKHYWPHLFLAGSIEQGKASNWQTRAIEFFDAQQELQDLVVINPRRESWNAELEQRRENREFNFQVSFELDHLEKADAVLMWLEPGTMSPISLLEFGLMAGWTSAGLLNKLVIGCPEGFWRKGNIEVVTDRYRIQLVSTFEETLTEGYTILRRNHARRMEFTGMKAVGPSIR